MVTLLEVHDGEGEDEDMLFRNVGSHLPVEIV
jgi:hypothetical protein